MENRSVIMNNIKRLWVGGVIAILLILGGSLGWWVVLREDRQMRQELLQKTLLVAQLINYQVVKTLKATEADLIDPGYQSLKSQLVEARKASDNYRFVYLLGRRGDGKVIVHVDSEIPASADYSPPGEVYEEVSDGFRHVFDNRIASVEGPVADRWGTWVSALIPLTDPATGELIAVMGMDIDARSWKWEVAARAALPVGLTMTVLILLSSWMIAVRLKADDSLRPVRRRLMIPLSGALMILVCGSSLLLLKQQQEHLHQSSHGTLDQASHDLNLLVTEQSRTLTAIGHILLQDSGLRTALLKDQDREQLQIINGPIYRKLLIDYGLTHFYFVGPDRVCLLRVHQPERYGDRIDRFTLLEAERTGKPVTGLELGPLGTFTLRHVQPVYDSGSLVGYLELGREIEDILTTLCSKNDVEVALVIRKTAIERTAWESGMKMLGRQADWDRFPDDVMIFSSLSAFPAEAEKLIGERHRRHDDVDIEMKFGDRSWLAMIDPVKDVSGSEVGSLIVFKDITAATANYNQLMGVGASLVLVLAAGLLSFVFVLLFRTDQGIRMQQEALLLQNDRYDLVINGVQDAVWDWDVPRHEMYVSPRWKEIRGYGETEIAGNEAEWFDGIHPEDAQRILARVQEHFEGKSDVFAEEYRIRCKDGSWKWILGRGVARRAADGNVVRMAGSEADITDRRKSEEALRESENRLSILFKSDPTGKIIINRNTRTIYDANDAALEMLGVTMAELVGKVCHGYFCPADIGKCPVCDIGQAVDRSERVMLKPDGTQLPILKTVVPIRLRGEDYLLESFIDISERKRTQEALRESEERFRKLFEQTREAILLMDDGCFIDANRAALEMLRMDGLDRLRMLTPADISPVYQPDGRLSTIKASEMIRIAYENEAHRFEWEHLRADGEPFIVEILMTSIQHKARKLLHMTWRDITENKRTEKALNNYRLNLEELVAERTAEIDAARIEQQAIFDSAPVGIVLIQDHQIMRCNREIDKIFGYERDELYGQTARIWYPDEAAYQCICDEISPKLEYGEIFCREKLLIRKNGTLFWARMTVKSLQKNEPGKGMLVIIEDVTGERHAHEALLAAKEQAEAATRAKSQFLANMSHEIRTPMNAIVGFAHLLKQDPLTPRQLNHLKKLFTAAKHLLQIINDILDLSKIEVSKMTLEIRDFEPSRVIDHVCGIVSDKVASKNLDMIVDMAHVPLVLRGDDMRLGQILLNLVGNAVKFTEKGSISIVVRVVSHVENIAVLRFEVRDTGIGMSQAQMDRLFRAFEQAESSTTRRFGGTGLGLAISKRLVEMMSGHIGVESEIDRGTLFWMEIPFEKSSQQPKHTRSIQSNQGERVLIIDDLADSREILATMRNDTGMKTDTADSGGVGLDEILTESEAGDKIGLSSSIPARTVEKDILSDLKAVDGLDVSVGLRSLLGNASQYVHLLSQFVEGHGNDAVLLAKQMDSGDLDAVRQTAHALKGVAGILGAINVQQSALDMEKAVRRRRGAEKLQEYLEILTRDLAELFDGLRAVLPDKNDRQTEKVIDRKQAGQILVQLESLLEADDTQVNEVFDQWRTLIIGALGNEGRQLERHIQNFDYADALETLKTILRSGFLQDRN